MENQIKEEEILKNSENESVKPEEKPENEKEKQEITNEDSQGPPEIKEEKVVEPVIKKTRKKRVKNNNLAEKEKKSTKIKVIKPAKLKNKVKIEVESDGLLAKKVEVRKALGIIRIVNNPLRRKMLNYLAHNGKVNVTELYMKLHIDQSIASQQLGLLRKEHLVNSIREGRHMDYTINKRSLNRVNRALEILSA